MSSFPRLLRVLYTPAQIEAFSGGGPEGPAISWRCCAVIDQLRATSTIVTALAHGAAAFYAVRSVEEARLLKRSKPGALLAGERGGLPPEGFDLGNSPRAFTPEAVGGREIILTTTNGTGALAACRGAETIVAASFLNLSAVVSLLAGSPAPRALLCAGTGNDFSLEDAIVAGAIAEEIAPGHPAAAIYRAVRGDLPSVLRRTVNGRRLIALGLEEDIAWSLQRDRFPVVPRGRVVDFIVEETPVTAVVLTR